MLRCSLFYVKHNAENWCNLEVAKSLPTTTYHSIRYLCINQIRDNCLSHAKIRNFRRTADLPAAWSGGWGVLNVEPFVVVGYQGDEQRHHRECYGGDVPPLVGLFHRGYDQIVEHKQASEV